MGGLLRVGRALPAGPSVMDRQRREHRGGAVLAPSIPDRVVAGCRAFRRDPNRLLLGLARGGTTVAPPAAWARGRAALGFSASALRLTCAVVICFEVRSELRRSKGSVARFLSWRRIET